MSKPTYLGANVDVTTDSFAGWIDKTNQIRYDMGTVVVTVGSVLQPNSTNGAQTSGNAHVQGYLSANTLVASDELRGGSVSGSGLLSITSNTTFANSELVEIANNSVNFHVKSSNTVIDSNTVINGTNATINSNLDVLGTSMDVSAVSTFTGNVAVNGAKVDVTANVNVTAANVYIDATETTIGSNSSDTMEVNSISTFQSDVTVNAITTVTANLVHSGTQATFNNDVILGSDATDTVSVIARVDTDVIPEITDTYDLGSTSLLWANVHATTLWAANVEVADVNATGTIGTVNATVSGTLTTGASSTVNLNGQINLGDDTTDTLTITARVDSAIIPLANTTYDLGSVDNYWRNLFVANLVSADTVELTGGRLEFASATHNNRMVVESGNTSYSTLKLEFNHTNGTVNSTPADFTRTEFGPIADRGYNLGTATERFDKGHIVAITANTATLGGSPGQQVLLTGGDVRIQGNFRVDGATTLSSNSVLALAESQIDDLTVFDSITLDPLAVWVGNVTPSVNNSVHIGSPTKVMASVHATNLNGNLAWSSITSKPDPRVTVTLTGDVTGSGFADLTDLANGAISFATTIQPNSVALGTDSTGNYVATVAAGGGMSVSGSGVETAAVTVSHADTSTVADVTVDNSNGTVVQDITLTFDTYGHVLTRTINSVNLDGRYYTETEADGRFVNATGDTMTGELVVNANTKSDFFGAASGNSAYFAAGETLAQFITNVPNTGEFVHIGAEGGVKVYSSDDDWGTAWATSKNEATLLDTSGNSSFPGTVSATTFSGAHTGSGAALTALNGSNISTGTVADARIATTIARTSRNINTGDGLSGGGNLSADRTLSVDSTVLRTSGNQSTSGTKTFTGKVVANTGGEGISVGTTSATGNPSIGFYQTSTLRGRVRYVDSGDYMEIINDTTAEALRIDSGVNGLLYIEGGNTRTVYHTGNLPAYPVVNDGTITVQGTGVLSGSGAFGLNDSGNLTINITHDVSAVTNVTDNSGSGVLVAGMNFDSYGHVTSVATADMDTRWVRIDLTGNQTLAGKITLGNVNADGLSVPSNTGIEIAGHRLVRGREDWSAVSGLQPTCLELFLEGGDDFIIMPDTNVPSSGNFWHFDRSTGDFSAYGDIISLSDRRTKTNIVKIEGALDKVLSLEGVYFDKIHDEDGHRHMGLIAQDVYEVVPELTRGSPDDESMMKVNYGNSVALLIEAIKDQQIQIEELKAKLEKIQ